MTRRIDTIPNAVSESRLRNTPSPTTLRPSFPQLVLQRFLRLGPQGCFWLGLGTKLGERLARFTQRMNNGQDAVAADVVRQNFAVVKFLPLDVLLVSISRTEAADVIFSTERRIGWFRLPNLLKASKYEM